MVPALNEGDYLPSLLDDLTGLKLSHEVLVVDGGSTDSTAAVAREGGARVLRAERSRARQMNAGARFLDTPWLLFLHADSRLGPRAQRALEGHVKANDQCVADGEPDLAAHYRFRVDGGGLFFRVLEVGQRIRERLFGLVYGDQGLLISDTLFEEVGGFPDEPLMEDVLLTRRLASEGRLTRLSAHLETSPRRYVEEGPFRRVARNCWNLTRFSLGTDPRALVRSYSPRAGTPPTPPVDRMDPNNALLVFAKAPRPGSVKTRLAASIGAHEAAQLYRRMARHIIGQAIDENHKTIVCFDPEDGESETRALLDIEPADFAYQGAGDLGARMSRCLELALRSADKAVVIGTDAPALGRALVRRAFDALDNADLVLGPTFDGGYYLLGLKQPTPGLFEGVPWSSPEVLEETAARAARLGLATVYLERLTDVDTVEDLTPELRATLGASPDTWKGA